MYISVVNAKFVFKIASYLELFLITACLQCPHDTRLQLRLEFNLELGLGFVNATLPWTLCT